MKVSRLGVPRLVFGLVVGTPEPSVDMGMLIVPLQATRLHFVTHSLADNSYTSPTVMIGRLLI